MAKGKHKRKKHNAQSNKDQSADPIVVVEETPVAHNETDNADKRTNRTHNQQSPRWWVRAWEHIKNSTTLSDWFIVAFTAVLTAVAVSQYFITDRQLDVMRKDERAWIVVEQEPPGITLAVGAAPSVNLAVKNTGKTQAKRVAGHCYVEIVPNGQNPHFESPVMHSQMITGGRRNRCVNEIRRRGASG